ncbi:mechanosensitive ion channel protein MscS [Alicyclobacillus hesperidum]|uniref:Mechanosensitive ion channel protein MscS n=1 Tax=Alicyclobacillus hesperidum TaxID=89784 RepID=A0A1H2UNS7_9BACL|nr:mechanosensitive ion channel family protein [Alicyclobacillus hesperidum]GLV14340.1 mechanosensitive ion channel protein MscS [Alicyclobacillus hesperidum]SDW57777.1 small conductance mechanosensitive channel [Alicyclobacillus hesperidum]
MQMWKTVQHYVATHVTGAEHISWDALRIVVLLIGAKIFIHVACKVLHKIIYSRNKLDERRQHTLNSLFTNIVRYSVYFILLLTILPIVGVHIEALLAGAGVAGIAIAFGAQSLLKDFFNGLFILFEDQYGVGDYVTINGLTGQVKSIGLRITVLKIWTGEVVVIPNGQIAQVVNFSKENSIAVIDVNVGYNADADLAISIVRDVMEQLRETQSNIVGSIDVLGMNALNDSNYTIRATAECEPYTQWSVMRLANQRIHRAFAEHGIDLPAQKVVYMQGGHKPVQA